MKKILGVTAVALVLGMASVPLLVEAEPQGPMATCPMTQCPCVQATAPKKGQPAPERAPNAVNEKQEDFLFLDEGD